ncbi:MAG: hypothetical protein PHF86_09610 [Candidatus Nanoarchaeia archaeon]|jgi:hypothetical protein|nr:hypothetical protein [Candidatus Nanoarchaeia archaeon]
MKYLTMLIIFVSLSAFAKDDVILKAPKCQTHPLADVLFLSPEQQKDKKFIKKVQDYQNKRDSNKKLWCYELICKLITEDFKDGWHTYILYHSSVLFNGICGYSRDRNNECGYAYDRLRKDGYKIVDEDRDDWRTWKTRISW